MTQDSRRTAGRSPRPAGAWPRRLAALLAVLAPAAAWSHDSWLQEVAAGERAGLLALHLGNGARYPRSEAVTAAPRVAQAACRGSAGSEAPLLPRAERPPWLELRSRLDVAGPVSCWLELRPQETVLDAAQVQAYLDEVRASDSVRAAWQAQQRAGLPWHEVYRKFLRLEKPGSLSDDGAAVPRAPRGFALEVVPLPGHPLRTGTTAEFLVLAHGRPVTGVPVEFISRRSPVGLWQQSDGAGRVRLALPYAGEWLLRTTVFDAPHKLGQPWQSRYASLNVTVQ